MRTLGKKIPILINDLFYRIKNLTLATSTPSKRNVKELQNIVC